MIRFQVGKEYKTRDGGETYRVTSISDNHMHCGAHQPILAVNVVSGEQWNWCENGLFNPLANETSMDLMPDADESPDVNFDDEWAKIRNLLNPILELVHDRGLVVKYSLRDQEITIKREV